MSEALATRLESIKNFTGVKSRELAQLLDTTPQSISRWQSGKGEPPAERLHRLLTLAWLAERLAEFYPPEEARLWLFSPHKLLNGDRPADRIQAGKLDDVLDLINQMKTGSYA
jgi:transcriptional regulator with XRE-family HTH domain